MATSGLTNGPTGPELTMEAKAAIQAYMLKFVIPSGAALAIISETTSPAPLRLTRRRKGRSVTPDMGARMTGSSSRIGPMEMLIFWANAKVA